MRYLPSPPKKLVWTVMSQLEIIIQICDLGSMKGCALQRSYSAAAMHSSPLFGETVILFIGTSEATPRRRCTRVPR